MSSRALAGLGAWRMLIRLALANPLCVGAQWVRALPGGTGPLLEDDGARRILPCPLVTRARKELVDSAVMQTMVKLATEDKMGNPLMANSTSCTILVFSDALPPLRHYLKQSDRASVTRVREITARCAQGLHEECARGSGINLQFVTL